MGERLSLKVAIVESNRLFRESLARVVRSDWTDAVAAASHDLSLLGDPDIVLVQCSNGAYPVALQLIKMFPDARVIGIDIDPTNVDLVDCVLRGIVGFILKDAADADILAAIKDVADGRRFVPPAVAAAICNQLYERRRNGLGLTGTAWGITGRERQIIRLIVSGMSNKEIGQKLNVATDTIKSHVHKILQKLQLRNRIELINYCWRDSTSLSSADEERSASTRSIM